MRIGLYPGSFDPITNGHIDIIKRSLPLVDKLIIAIGVSATKKPLFSFQQREAMLKAEIGGLAEELGVEIELISFQDLLVNVARAHKAQIIIRGLRNGEDFEYEAQMTAMNRTMADDIETIFLSASPETAHISSTLVRQIQSMKGDISPFVPKAVMDNIKQ